MDHYERLGLPRRFLLDAAALERAYLARSREVHPDFHQSASDAEQRASQELSAALNEAYVALRDPFKRAEYLLKLLGGPSASEAKQMDPTFLMETLELREAMEEMRGDPVKLAALGQNLTDRAYQLVTEIDERFARSEPPLLELRQRLNAFKYLRNLLRDLNADGDGD